LTAGEPTRAGDLYGLGATLYLLLAGRPPVEGPDPATILDELRTGTPADLAALRPDVPAPVVELVQALMARDPADRPTAAEAAGRLAAALPGSAPAAPAAPAPASSIVTGLGGPPAARPPSSAILNGHGTTHEPPVGQPVPESEVEDQPSGWVAVPYSGTGDSATSTFVPPAYEDWNHPESQADPVAFTAPSDDTLLKPRTANHRDRSRVWWWITIGAGLQLLALAGWALLVFQPGCPTDGPSKTAPPPRKAATQTPAGEVD
jgi:serine/threonine-protein kinase